MQQQKRIIGQTRDAGFQIGVRRTFPITHEAAWRLLTSAEGIRIWLDVSTDVELVQGASYRLTDGTHGQVSVFTPGSHLRMTWQPPGWARPSIIQLRVIANRERTAIAFHQEHLPGPAEREMRRAFYMAALDQIERLIESKRKAI
jgi:uncharacterized protein YndB with AHSA1/START domain